MNKYDLYYAEFPFDDTEESKVRPVLILNDSVCFAVVFKISSKGKTARIQYRIKDWKGAGLQMESFIYINQSYRLEKAKFKEKIGTLQLEDRFALENRLITLM